MEEVLRYWKAVLSRLKNYNPKKRLQEILKEPQVQRQIINLIQKRIEENGRLSDGERLVTDAGRRDGTGSYSIGNYEKRDQRYVDLKVTGEFFNQWKLSVGANESKIFADKITEIYDNFEDSFASSQEMMDRLGTLSKEEQVLIRDNVVMPIIYDDIEQIFNV